MAANETQPSPAAAARARLRGRAFYESIGSPTFVLAPMVAQSEFAWRMLTRSYLKPHEQNKLLAYTPMFHARLFSETKQFRDMHFQPVKAGLDQPLHEIPAKQHDHLDGRPGIDRPLTVQFCANDPQELLAAARYVQPYCDAVDLNLGCPQGIARKGHYGAFLQEDWDLVANLIGTLNRELEVPVTAKIRRLETKEKTLEYAKRIVDAGASILTVHGRLREQKGHLTGLADWSYIKYLRDNLPKELVMFINGNVLQHEDIKRALDATGVDGVMSAEGNLSDPTIFAEPPAVGEEGRDYWRGQDGKGGFRVDSVFRRYLDIIYQHVLGRSPPERPPLFVLSDPRTTESSSELTNAQSPSAGVKRARDTEDDDPQPKKRRKSEKKGKSGAKRVHDPNLLGMRPHLFHLLRQLVSIHTNVRDALARAHPGDMEAFENVLALAEEAVKHGLLEYEKDPSKFENPPDEASSAAESTEITDRESSVATVKACKRPYWVCQPYVRPLPEEALEKGAISLSKKKLQEKSDGSQASTSDPPAGMTVERDAAQERLATVAGAVEEIPKEPMVAG